MAVLKVSGNETWTKGPISAGDMPPSERLLSGHYYWAHCVTGPRIGSAARFLDLFPLDALRSHYKSVLAEGRRISPTKVTPK